MNPPDYLCYRPGAALLELTDHERIRPDRVGLVVTGHGARSPIRKGF